MTDQDRAILDHEGAFYRHRGAKEAAVRERFGLSSTEYHQRLNAMLDQPEAVAYAPATVHRLLRLREQRRVLRGRR